LGIANICDNTEVKADRYPQYEVKTHFFSIQYFHIFNKVYINAPSQNKLLPHTTIFLDQVFPDSLKFYHNFLLKVCSEDYLDFVENLLQKLYPLLINMYE